MRLIKKKKVIDSNVKINFFINIFSSFFFTGYFPYASGTIGSLAALSIFIFYFFSNPIILLLLISVCFIIGIYTCNFMMKKFGDDPSVVVIDEAVGMWTTVFIFILCSNSLGSYTGYYPAMTNINLPHLLICFLTFRFFDIAKIQPAKYFDKLKSGFGVMMDDIVAAVYAGIASIFISLIW